MKTIVGIKSINEIFFNCLLNKTIKIIELNCLMQ